MLLSYSVYVKIIQIIKSGKIGVIAGINFLFQLFLRHESVKNKRVLIMAGGTGGHVFPALAIAKKLQDNGYEILWLGTRGRMEEMLVPKHGFNIEYIDVKGIRRNGFKAKLFAPFMLIRAVCEAFYVLRKFRPSVCIGMGGYASGPGGVAAYLLRIPLVLHEQNAAAGLTNRLLFKLASRVLLGFPGAFSGNKVKLVGNPVRDEIMALHEAKRDFNYGKLCVLIIGGSLGAKALNEKLPDALKQFGNEIEVIHQAGKGNSAATLKRYSGAAFSYQVSDFINDMDKVYMWAHLIVCRAGALTVAEVSAAGLPAVFVPLPTAVDDHQTKNAMTMVNAGAAKLIAQKDLNADSLKAALEPLLNDRALLEKMSQNARARASLHATDAVVEVIDSLVK